MVKFDRVRKTLYYMGVIINFDNMPEEKKNPEDVSKDESKETPKGGSDSQQGGDNKPSYEELLAQNAEQSKQIENLKGTQSATSKSFTEIKTQLEGFQKSFKEAGIDPSQLNNIIDQQKRTNILFEVAAEKGLSASDLEFIKGNTKEEIEASVDKFQAAIQSRVDAVKPKDPEKKELPKNNAPGTKVNPKVDNSEQAKKFLQKNKMVPKSK